MSRTRLLLYRIHLTVWLAVGATSGLAAEQGLLWTARTDSTLSRRIRAAERVADGRLSQRLLHEILLTVSPEFGDREAFVGVVGRLDDVAVLSRLARDRRVDDDVRQAAIARLSDQELLAAIARDDDDEYVRGAALARLTDRSLMVEILRSTAGCGAVYVPASGASWVAGREVKLAPKAVVSAMQLLPGDVLLEMAAPGSLPAVRQEAVSALEDVRVLQRIALTDADHHLRFAALRRLARGPGEATALASATVSEAMRGAGPRFRRALLDLADEDLLSRIARDPEEPDEIRIRALLWARDRSLVAELASTPGPVPLRIAAVCWLARRGGEEELARLLPGLQPAAVRAAAERALGQAQVLPELADLDEEVRREKVGAIRDAALLARIARQDPSLGVRQAARERLAYGDLRDAIALEHLAERWASGRSTSEIEDIRDPRTLARLASTHPQSAVRDAALARADPGLLREALLREVDDSTLQVAVRRTTDTELLAALAPSFPAWARQAAMKRLPQATLAEIAGANPSLATRLAAVEALEDEAALGALARSDAPRRVRRAAIERTSSQSVLAEIVRTETDADLRTAAAERISGKAVLLGLMRGETDPLVRAALVARLKDARRLVEIAMDDEEPVEVQVAAVRALGKPWKTWAMARGCREGDAGACRRLLERARDADEPWDRAQAARWLTDPAAVGRIARSDMSPEVRLAAADRIEDATERLAVLFALAATDCTRAASARITDPEIAAWIALDWGPDAAAGAARQVTDPSVLRELALVRGGPAGQVALQRLGDPRLAARVVRASKERMSFDMIEDSEQLRELASSARQRENRIHACEKLGDPRLLAGLAKGSPWKAARLTAIVALRDHPVLGEIARGADTLDLRRSAVWFLDDQRVLAEIARQDPSAAVRSAAAARLKDGSTLAALAADENQDEGVRLAALQALGRHRPAHLDRLPVWPLWAGEEVERLTDDALLKRLVYSHPDFFSRDRALKLLERRGGIDASTWQELALGHGDDQIRRYATMMVSDPTTLERVARFDQETGARKVAVDRIEARSVLVAVLGTDPEPEVRSAAAKRLDHKTLLSVATGDGWVAARLSALDELTRRDRDGSAPTLEALAWHDPDPEVRTQAIRWLPQTALARLAVEHPDPLARRAAVQRLEDETLLLRLARSGQEPVLLRVAAVQRLKDPAVLSELATGSGSRTVALSAARRIGLLRPCRSNDDGSTDQTLAGVAEASQDVAVRELVYAALGDQRALGRVASRSESARAVKARRSAEERRRRAAEWAMVGGLGLEVGSPLGVGVSAPGALITGAGSTYYGPSGRLGLGYRGASAELGYRVGLLGGTEVHNVGVIPFPLLDVTAGGLLFQSFDRNVGCPGTCWGFKVDVGLFSVLRVGYTRLWPRGRGDSYDSWHFAIEVPLGGRGF